MAAESQVCRADRKRNKRQFRHMMQAKVALGVNSRASMTNAQMRAATKQTVDRYFAWVRSQKPDALDAPTSPLPTE